MCCWATEVSIGVILPCSGCLQCVLLAPLSTREANEMPGRALIGSSTTTAVPQLSIIIIIIITSFLLWKLEAVNSKAR